MAKIGLKSTFRGQRDRCHRLSRWVASYRRRTWPAQPKPATAEAIVRKARTSRIQASQRARFKYADSSADVAELREWRDDVRRGDGLIVKAEAS